MNVFPPKKMCFRSGPLLSKAVVKGCLLLIRYLPQSDIYIDKIIKKKSFFIISTCLHL